MPIVDTTFSYSILVLMLVMRRIAMKRINVIAHIGEHDLCLDMGEIL